MYWLRVYVTSNDDLRGNFHWLFIIRKQLLKVNRIEKRGSKTSWQKLAISSVITVICDRKWIGCISRNVNKSNWIQYYCTRV